MSDARPIVVVGAALPEFRLTVDRLPARGGDEPARRAAVLVGGCGFNVAVGLRRLGLDPLFVYVEGTGPLAPLVRRALKAAGVRWQARRRRRPTGFSVTLVEPDGERTFVTAAGAETELGGPDLARAGAAGAAIVYASGYEAAASPSLDRALGELPRTVELVFDPGPLAAGPDAARAAWARANLIRLNAREAALATGETDLRRAVARLLRPGRAVVVSDGPRGAWWGLDGDVGHVPGRPVAAADTTGAGDRHAAALIAARVRGEGLPAAVAFANEAVARYLAGEA
jgi:sugar/nucleoside kinase (ribokinase family)